MRLTTKGRFAVTAMIDVAMHSGNGPVTLAGVSERQKISLSYLEQLFGKLRRHGLVESVRGPGGGYNLAQPAASLSVADIILAVDEPIDATQCGGKENCKDDKRCMTHELWAAPERAYLQLPALGHARAAGACSRTRAEVNVLQDHRGAEQEARARAGRLRVRGNDEKTDLPRLLGDDAGRSARRGENDSVSYGAVRQSRVAFARVRLDQREGGRGGARGSREAGQLRPA